MAIDLEKVKSALNKQVKNDEKLYTVHEYMDKHLYIGITVPNSYKEGDPVPMGLDVAYPTIDYKTGKTDTITMLDYIDACDNDKIEPLE